MSEGRPFEPSRLIVARRRAGVSRSALARDCGLKARSIVAYEQGERAPSADALAAIAKRLNFPEEFFSGAPMERLKAAGVSFRSLVKTPSVDREKAVAAGEMALGLADFVESEFNLHACRVPDLHLQQGPEVAAQMLRTLWALGDAPLPNVVRLLEANGVLVFSLAENTRDIDAFSFWRKERPFVFLNTLKSPERSRFDACHELYHLVAHRHGVVSGRIAEQEAQRFASAFLMPETSLRRYAPRNPTLQDLVKAKRAWGVSVAALAYRMHTLGMLTEWHYRSLCIQIQTHRYGAEEPNSIPRELSSVWPEVFSALKTDGVTRADLARKLSWPLDELRGLVFQLVLSADPGGGSGTDSSTSPPIRRLQLER